MERSHKHVIHANQIDNTSSFLRQFSSSAKDYSERLQMLRLKAIELSGAGITKRPLNASAFDAPGALSSQPLRVHRPLLQMVEEDKSFIQFLESL